MKNVKDIIKSKKTLVLSANDLTKLLKMNIVIQPVRFFVSVKKATKVKMFNKQQ